MKTIHSIVLIVCYVTQLISAGELELPPYIPKCSISDPNLGECFKEKANIVIPIIAKGDPNFEIQPVSPITLTMADVKAINLRVFNISTDDIKNLKIVNATLDFKNGKAAFAATIKRIEGIAQNYSITSGELLGVPVSGHGKFNITIEGVIINYKADIHVYEKDGDKYMELVNTTITSDIERGHYYFEGLKSPEKSDVNKFIDENWRLFRMSISPAVNYYLNQFVNIPVKAIFSRIPLRNIFLP